jgi:hypothetical protein
METNLGQSTSIWMRAMRPSYSKLAQNLTADVCVDPNSPKSTQAYFVRFVTKKFD